MNPDPLQLSETRGLDDEPRSGWALVYGAIALVVAVVLLAAWLA